eukprot:c30558_g1_i1.p1 GENE.c30558_g1_i1~~c30558_g1_i1.p1  ORF type:complete len:362 (+),score=148.79 c30558_g1_i1:420-1505(+)
MIELKPVHYLFLGFICGFIFSFPTFFNDRNYFQARVIPLKEGIPLYSKHHLAKPITSSKAQDETEQETEITKLTTKFISEHEEIYKQSETQNGILYISFGMKYLDELMHSVSNIEGHTEYSSHITLLTDLEGVKMIEDHNMSHYFEYVLDITPALPKVQLPRARSYKLVGLLLSPYKNTLFFDTDTSLCLSGIDDLFQLIDLGYDIAAVPDPNNNFATVESATIPPFFPQLNTGVMVYRKMKIFPKLVSDWHEKLSSETEDGIIRKDNGEHRFLDQPEFHWQLWINRHKVRVYYLDDIYNCRITKPEVRAKALEKDVKYITSILKSKGRCGFVPKGCIVEHSNFSESKWVRRLQLYTQIQQ